jgi:hypothetical protein
VRNAAYQITALLACGLLTACGASKATTSSAQPAGHAINMFGNGKTPPPLLRQLTATQAAHLPVLRFSYGPTYQQGRLIGVAVHYPGCQTVRGARVSETASAVTVTVYGSPFRNCQLVLRAGVWAVKLPHPLGSRTELRHS